MITNTSVVDDEDDEEEDEGEKKLRAPTIVEFICMVLFWFLVCTAVKGCKDGGRHGPKFGEMKNDTQRIISRT
jgi:hypothetical protein